MIRTMSWAALGAFLFLGLAPSGWAADPEGAISPREARALVERLLGSDREEAQMRSYLLFTRQFRASGIVARSLAASTAAAGVPPAAMLEALRAFGATIDVERDPRDGDRFYVRYERTFTAEGHPVGIGRVLWAELRLATKGTVAIHRFRASGGADSFWLANGQSTAPPAIRLPVDHMVVSSAFGMRADPMDQPSARIAVIGSGTAGSRATAPRPVPPLPPALKSGKVGTADLLDDGASRSVVSTGLSEFNKATPLGISLGLSPNGTARGAPSARATTPARPLAMHEGVDLAAPPGTPVFAAGDGTVKGAAPNGGYGNWILIEQDGGKLSTVYGHLSAFAPGIEPGTRVMQGELIGFVGNTGRSTGPHLHFELRSDGRPVNPMNYPATKRAQLAGADLERFRDQMKRALRDRDRADTPVLPVDGS